MNSTANIISASRRTDIPAFYSDWFMQRLNAGYVEVVNPFNAHQVSRVSLLPHDVAALVFWTRNPLPLIPYLEAIQRMLPRFYFHCSINNYPKALEKRNPAPDRMIQAMHQLATRYSPLHLQWRYDPVVLTEQTDAEWHVNNFTRLAAKLAGATTRCYISFLDVYRKTARNLATASPPITLHSPSREQEIALVARLQPIASEHGITLYSCCEDHCVTIPGVAKARCVDVDLLMQLFPDASFSKRSGKTREQCGCFASKDIGAYDSCLFACTYCYANADFDGRSQKRWQQHQPDAARLIP